MKLMRSFLGLSLCAAMLASAPAGAGNDLARSLAGTWDGWGTIRLADGSQDKLRCRAVFVGQGATIRETLTCQGGSYRIEGGASYFLSGAAVSGSWSESAFGVGGGLSGHAGGSRLDLVLQGPTFTAQYALRLEGCRLSFSVRPVGVTVESVSATLRNCRK